MAQILNEVVSLADWRTYFNAGVLVMDLNRLRDTGLIHVAEKFLEQTNYKTVYVDQDALNHVVNGAFVRLDLRWNVLANRRESDVNNADRDSERWIHMMPAPTSPGVAKGGGAHFGIGGFGWRPRNPPCCRCWRGPIWKRASGAD